MGSPRLHPGVRLRQGARLPRRAAGSAISGQGVSAPRQPAPPASCPPPQEVLRNLPGDPVALALQAVVR